jgi:hypothetical protein
VRTGSLRLRVTVVTLAILVAALLAFSITVTILYRNGLERDLRHRLQSGGKALSLSPPEAFKQVMGSLTLEGIRARVYGNGGIASKRGVAEPLPKKPLSVVSHNGLLTLTVALQGDPRATVRCSPRARRRSTTRCVAWC